MRAPRRDPTPARLLLLGVGIALTGCLGSDESDPPQPDGRLDRTFVAPAAKRLDSVPRSPHGLGRAPPSDREVALADRIMRANAYLGRLLADDGRYRIAETGTVNAAGRDRILGLILELRLEEAADGVYELPVICHGEAGRPFALPPTPFVLNGVSRLLVTVTFADRRVASIDPRNGTALPAPGAAFMSAPSSCERRAASY